MKKGIEAANKAINNLSVFSYGLFSFSGSLNEINNARKSNQTNKRR